MPMLEYPEKMCEYCCNFDKEHIGMDGMTLCKLTMTLAYAEDYGGNCMFYNVPKEQIFVPPCKLGDKVCEIEKSCLRCMHFVDDDYSNFCECALDDSKLMFECDFDKECCYDIVPKRFDFGMIERIGKTVFLTKEEAEAELVKRSKTNA